MATTGSGDALASAGVIIQGITAGGHRLAQENRQLTHELVSTTQLVKSLRAELISAKSSGARADQLEATLRQRETEILSLRSRLVTQKPAVTPPLPAPSRYGQTPPGPRRAPPLALGDRTVRSVTDCHFPGSTPKTTHGSADPLPERDRTPTYTPSPLRRSLLDPSYTPYSPGNGIFSYSPPEDRTPTAPYGNSPPTPYERGDYEELHQQAQKCIAQSRRTKALSQQSRAQTEKFYAQWRQSLASLDRTLAQSRRVSDETRAVLAQTPLATQRLDALALARWTSEHSDWLQARGGHSMDLTRSPGLPVVLPSPDRIEDVWIHIRYSRV